MRILTSPSRNLDPTATGRPNGNRSAQRQPVGPTATDRPDGNRSTRRQPVDPTVTGRPNGNRSTQRQPVDPTTSLIQTIERELLESCKKEISMTQSNVEFARTIKFFP